MQTNPAIEQSEAFPWPRVG